MLSHKLVDAMRKNDADGVAVCEAHEDPEIFRLRLGKCLNFEVSAQSSQPIDAEQEMTV